MLAYIHIVKDISLILQAHSLHVCNNEMLGMGLGTIKLLVQ